jgi:putative hydrolase
MKYELDMHTHTIASGHAYSTMAEMIEAAHQKGLKALGIVEHTSAMPGTCDDIYFLNLKVVPREQKGMRIYLGAEVNIIDYDGNIDLPQHCMDCLDYAIASIHPPCLRSGTMEENTQAMLKVMENPKVRIIGHPDDGRFPLDYEALVKGAKQHGVLLEVNNNSLNPNGFRHNTVENCSIMLELCKQYLVPVIMNSDAHITFEVGNHNYSQPVIEKLDFPEELIINTSLEKWMNFIEEER